MSELEEAKLSERSHALYGKLHASRDDLSIAAACAAFIKKKKWHSPAVFRRGSIYIQQVAFTTTMIVAYARPFFPGRGNIDFPRRLIQYPAEEMALHIRLLDLRKKEYAHTDASTYSVRPLKGPLITSVDSIRDVHFTHSDIELFLGMSAGLIRRLNTRMEEIRRSGC